MASEPEVFYLEDLDEHTVVPPGEIERALREAEGKTLPLRDRPGGRIIGTVEIRRG